MDRIYISEMQEDILKKRRGFFQHKVKEPLMLGIVRCSRRYSWVGRLALLWEVWRIVRAIQRYPKPTRKNCKNPNTLVLLDLVEWFLSNEDNPPHPDPEACPYFGRYQLFEAFFTGLLAEHEHDNYYTQRADKFLEKWYEYRISGKWIPAPAWSPMECWKDPETNEARVEAINQIFIDLKRQADEKIAQEV